MINNTDRVRVEEILVVKKGLTATAPLNPKGTAYSNDTASAITVNGNTFQPGEIMLETGQLGIFNAYDYVAVDATSTISTDPAIFLAVKRDESLDADVLPNKPVVKSNPIVGKNSVVFTGTDYKAPSNQIFLLGDAIGQTGVITPADETDYKLMFSYEGRRTDILNARNAPQSVINFTTPDYTTLAYTAPNALDHFIQNIAYNGIVDSVVYHPGGNQAVPLAIDSVGAGAGTLISSLVAGGSVQIANNSLGEVVNLKLTASMVASLQSTLVANGGVVPDTAKIVPAIKTTAGTGVAVTDMILVVVEDQAKAVYDKIAQVKTRIKVGLSKGFTPSVRKVEVSTPYEGQNTGRELKLWFDATAGLRNYNGQELTGLDGGLLSYPDTIDASKNYAVYTILHSDVASTSQGTPSEAPLVTVVLVEEDDAATKTAIEAVLNPYFKTIPFASFEGETTAAGVVIA